MQVDRHGQGLLNGNPERSVADCATQMAEHLHRHLNPRQAGEESSSAALKRMFSDIGVWCLPHPGFAVQKDWKLLWQATAIS